MRLYLKHLITLVTLHASQHLHAYASADTGSAVGNPSDWFSKVFLNAKSDAGKFPGIYTVVLPLDDLYTEAVKEFVGRVDLLKSVKIDDSSFEAKFLIHAEEEFDMISRSNSLNVEIIRNDEETQHLHRTMNPPATEDARIGTIDGFPCYRNVQGAFDLMDALVEQASSINSLSVEVKDIGDTYLKTLNSAEGYDMKVLIITGNGVEARGMTTEKGIVFITCGIHAREYAGPELCSRWAEQLVNGYGTDAEVTTILDHTEVYLVLEANPDGRVVAESNRPILWRKNVRPGCFLSFAEGTDLNRNFPFKWGGSGSSGFSCAQNYRGTEPQSEPEVQAIIEYAKTIFPVEQRKDDPIGQINEPFPETIRGVYFDIHSYSELIIWPWSYQNRLSPNDEGLQALARKFRNFNGYALAGPELPDFLYPADGVTADWFHGELGAAAFVYELGTDFYQDCSTFNNKIAPENLPSFMYAARSSTAPFSLSKGPDITELSLSDNIRYHPAADVAITVTVSDSALSSGAGNFQTSTQSISSISVALDMHPYDKDGSGNGPNIVQFPVDDNSGTVTKTVSIPLSLLEPLLRGSSVGSHTIYVYGTDSDGYDGLVTTKSFEIECNNEPTFSLKGTDMTCESMDEGLCNDIEYQKFCPKVCSVC